jgi:molybdopterin-guanine dinucleotide biosynthesis protein A
MGTLTTSAAILAGGRARRLGGRDKSRLVVDGRTIIVRQVETLQRVADEVFVVGHDAGRFADVGLTVHTDRIADKGVLGGLYTALDAARGDAVLVVACDLPFLHEGLLRELVHRSRDGDGAWIRTPSGVEPLLACYQRRVRDRVFAEISAGRLKAGDLGHVLQMAELDQADLTRFGSSDDLLANINTPDDYARVQYRAR